MEVSGWSSSNKAQQSETNELSDNNVARSIAMSPRSHQSAVIIQRALRRWRLRSLSRNHRSLGQLSPHQRLRRDRSATNSSAGAAVGFIMPANIVIQPQIGARGEHEFLDFTEISFDESYGNIIEHPPGTARNREQPSLQHHLEEEDEEDNSSDDDDDDSEADDKVDAGTVLTRGLLSKAGVTVVSKAVSMATETSAADEDDVAAGAGFVKSSGGGGGAGNGGGGASGNAAVTSAAQGAQAATAQ